jgi:hypothetical protein
MLTILPLHLCSLDLKKINALNFLFLQFIVINQNQEKSFCYIIFIFVENGFRQMIEMVYETSIFESLKASRHGHGLVHSSWPWASSTKLFFGGGCF